MCEKLVGSMTDPCAGMPVSRVSAWAISGFIMFVCIKNPCAGCLCAVCEGARCPCVSGMFAEDLEMSF